MKRVLNLVAAAFLAAGLSVAVIQPAQAGPTPAPSAPAKGDPTKPVKGLPLSSKTKGGVKALTACTPNCLGYAGQMYTASTKVVTATKSTSRIAMPSRDSGDFHSLGETAVISYLTGGTRNIVEVGWNVDPTVNGGSDQPTLFVFAWYNDVGCGYNGTGTNTCGYVDNASNPVNAGSNIFADKDTEQSFEIYHYAPSSRWIINYKGVQVGYYPDSLNHSAAFTTADEVQNFGEVAVAKIPSCTNMGSGNFPNLNGQYPTHGTEFKALNVGTSGGSYATASYTGNIESNPTMWSVYPYAAGAFRYGGPGAGSPLTSPSACP